MLNKLKIFIVFLASIHFLCAQNLVKNGSFELTDFWKCVTSVQNPNNANDPYGKLSFSSSYYQPEKGIRGLLSNLPMSITCVSLCSASANTFVGKKLPRSGSNLISAIPEYSAFELSNYLLKNEKYVFECYLSGNLLNKFHAPFSSYNGQINLNFGNINANDSTTGWLVVNLLKNTSQFFKAHDGIVINNIKHIDTLSWTKISACFTPKIDSISLISFHSNISAFMDDIAIYPAQNFNVNLTTKPCDKKINYAIINPLPNYNYTYNFGDSNNIVTHSNVMSHIYSKEGLYNSHIIGRDTITNQFFCSSSKINIDYIEANFSHPNIISTEVSVQILNASTNASSFNWTLNNQSISSNENPAIKFPSGLNQLCLRAKNKSGCVDSVCKEIYVHKCDRISEANIFTPNDDNVNDLLYFFDGNPCDTNSIRISVFNRWGQIYYHYPILGLFELNEPISDHFKPTKFYTYKYWNGYLNNLGPKQADPGVYFIIIETPSIRKTKTVTLIR
jgi:hypothetical protein